MRWLGGDEVEVAAGWLHDVVEDTPVSLGALASVFPARVVEAVDALTRREGEPYFEYIERARENRVARTVKRCDLAHNLDVSRLPGGGVDLSEADVARLVRYERARTVLAGVAM